jgi:hypothetical protein
MADATLLGQCSARDEDYCFVDIQVANGTRIVVMAAHLEGPSGPVPQVMIWRLVGTFGGPIWKSPSARSASLHGRASANLTDRGER